MTGAQHKVVGIGFGIAGTYAVMHGLGDPYGALILPAATVGCMLPDIDHDRTKIGRKRNFITTLLSKGTDAVIILAVLVLTVLIGVTMVGFRDWGLNPIQLIVMLVGVLFVAYARATVKNSKTFKWAAKHRGIMHTLVVPVIGYIAMGASDFPLWKYSLMGCVLGYLSHLFADMLTVEGCPVLFPLTRNNIRFLTLRTKNKSCSVAAFIVAALAVVGTFALFYVKEELGWI